jgi:hypothetical protein
LKEDEATYYLDNDDTEEHDQFLYGENDDEEEDDGGRSHLLELRPMF